MLKRRDHGFFDNARNKFERCLQFSKEIAELFEWQRQNRRFRG